MAKSRIKKPGFSKKQKNWLITLSVLAVLLVSYDLYMPRNIQFYAKWVTCGERPVGSRGSGLFNVGVPYYEKVQLLRVFHGYIDYYCTPLEAERAGYSANPEVYRMPHLDAIGESWPRLY